MYGVDRSIKFKEFLVRRFIMEIPNSQLNAGIIFSRKSDDVARLEGYWREIEDAYKGGPDYMRRILNKHPSETDEEYAERLENSYYFNYIKKIVQKLTDLLFSKEPYRSGADETIVSDFNKMGLNANEVMKLVFTYSVLFQRAWVYVDCPKVTGEVSILSKMENGIRPYAIPLTPMQVPDYHYGENGELEWAIVELNGVDKSNPFSSPAPYVKRVLWTKDYYIVYKMDGVGSQSVKVIESGVNELGKVPLIQYVDLYEVVRDSVPPMLDIVQISNAITRGESELLTNILKQAYGLLVVPASFLMNQESVLAKAMDEYGIEEGSDELDYIKKRYQAEISRSKCIVEDDEEKGITRYISPNGVTTDSIETHNDRLMARLYEMAGLVVSSSTAQRESAESKAWGNIDISAFLQTKAQQLEQIEQSVWELLYEFDATVKKPADITYNRDFVIKDFKAMIMGVKELSSIDAGVEYQKALKYVATDLLNDISKLPADSAKKIMSEIVDGVVSADDELANVELRTNGTVEQSEDDKFNATTDYDENLALKVTNTQEK
jgi:hypothetical protein